MKAARYGGALLLGVILLYAFVVYFSAREHRYECAGTLARHDTSAASTVYIKLAEYRWWVGLWSDSDAALSLEIPNETLEYFGHLIQVGDQLQIYGSKKDIRGNFSTLSKTLALRTPNGFFDGSCKRIDA